MIRNPQGGVQGPKVISLDRPLPVKIACQSCRSGHKKCDAALPICSRCKKDQNICDYTPSRRGRAVAHLHKKSMKPIYSRAVDYSPTSQEVLPVAPAKDAPIWLFRKQSEDGSLTRMVGEDALTDPVAAPQTRTSPAPKPYYVSAFYSSFWPAHPFLPPMRHLEEHLEKSEGTGLSIIIDLIGSKYANLHYGRLGSLNDQQSLPQYPQSGPSVQALILLAIFYHMTNNKAEAQAALREAVRIALFIGLDKKTFAFDHGRGIPSIEESWRRTWWKLYILDVMFAALNQTSDLQLKGVLLEVFLPCEEATYRTEEALPKPQSLTMFDARFFLDDEIEYSSFSYRIAATRALAKIIMVSCAQEAPPSSSVRNAELEMENLKLHLPTKMQIYVDSEDGVDEVAFQAHMIMNAGTIYLHRPQSLLASPNPDYTIACAPNNATTHSYSIQYHSKKTVDAANEICHMISASSTLVNHTPFFICAVAMQAIIHLGMYCMPQWSSQQALAEQQIKMSIGALKKLSQVWQMAEIVRQDVKSVARGLLDTAQSSHSSDTGMAAEKLVVPQPALEQNRVEELSPFNFDGMSQAYDDFWMDEFLGVNAVI